MPTKKSSVLLIGGIVVIAAIFIYRSFFFEDTVEDQSLLEELITKSQEADKKESLAATQIDATSTREQPSISIDDTLLPPPSPFALRLGRPDRTEKDAVETVGEMIHYMAHQLDGQRPLATNPEITGALTTTKDGGVVFLPNDHASINSAGELVDRWQTPYFFHALSSVEIEVQSAGPDKEHFTEDDLTWTPRPDDPRSIIYR